MQINNIRELAPDLLNALNNHEFILHYQPEYNLVTSTFEGVEALIRWNHPNYGCLLPGQFIPLAEELNIIDAIGRWVLVTACQQNKDWQRKGLPPMRVSVNVSGMQFDQPDFVDFVFKTLEHIELAPQYLELELNENIIITYDDKSIIEMVKRLSEKGIQIALDDFGTGHSTISYINLIPVNRIKIDKSYIENISTDPKDAAIVKAIIALAADLNLQVLAEGIESLIQLQTLTQMKGVEIQGFYFSEPLPAEEVEKFLRSKINQETK